MQIMGRLHTRAGGGSYRCVVMKPGPMHAERGGCGAYANHQQALPAGKTFMPLETLV